MRRVLDFCGLAWDPACVDLTANESAVATLSPRRCASRSSARNQGMEALREAARAAPEGARRALALTDSPITIR